MSRLSEPLDRLLAEPFGDWQPVIAAWRGSAEGARCVQAVDARVAAGAVVYPAQVFRALRLTPLAATRVVILGQDPYHGAGQAEGLAFSVPAGVRPPPSLRNLFQELHRDLGVPPPAAGSLVPWAERGVLLLNATLTVEDGRPASHAALGWQALTDRIVVALAADRRPKVFMLWGAHAQRLSSGIAEAAASAIASASQHLVLHCNHPSPLSARRPPRPFIGCGHFGLASRFLERAGLGPIDWAL